MPAIFSHAIVAATLGRQAPKQQRGVKMVILAVFCALIPDADVLVFSFAIPFEHVLGHRGLTHLFLFVAALGALLATAAYRNLPALTAIVVEVVPLLLYRHRLG